MFQPGNLGEVLEEKKLGKEVKSQGKTCIGDNEKKVELIEGNQMKALETIIGLLIGSGSGR